MSSVTVSPSCSCSFVSHAAGPPHIEKFDMAAVGAFSTTTTFLPASDSLRAAMRPAAPAPTTTASHSFVLLPSLRGMPSCALGSSAVAAPPSLAAAAPFCFGAQPASPAPAANAPMALRPRNARRSIDVSMIVLLPVVNGTARRAFPWGLRRQDRSAAADMTTRRRILGRSEQAHIPADGGDALLQAKER